MRSLALAWLWLVAFAWAAEPVVSAPPDRVVDPGAYATLVFRVETRTDVRATVAVRLPEGWRIVRTPDVVELSADRSTPVALTVGVPASAPAGAVEQVTIRIEAAGAASEGSVHLTVAAVHGLALSSPQEHAIGPDPLVVDVRNTGNVRDVFDVALLRLGRAVASQRLEIAAGEEVAISFDVPVEGSYVVTASSSGGPIERRNVDVVRIGGPDPAPFAVAGEVVARVAVGSTVDLAIALAGPLSDVLRLDARLEATDLERTHIELRGDRFTVRLGRGWRDPFRLGTPNDTLLAGTVNLPSDWAAGAIVAGALDGPTLAAVAIGRTWPGVDIAAGIGWRLDDPWVSLRGTVAVADWNVGGAWRSEGGLSALRVEGVAAASWGTTTFGVDASGLGGDRARVAVGAQYAHLTTRLYVRAESPLAGDAMWGGHVGATTTITDALPGDLRLSAEAGHLERRFRVEHRGTLPGDWRTLVAIDGRADQSGFGLGGEARWVQAASGRYAAYGARVDYASVQAAWRTRLSIQQQRETGPWVWTVDGAWDSSERRLVARADAAREIGLWRVGVAGGLAYAYGDASAPWRADLSLRASYGWTWSVPEVVTTLVGGRALGIVEGAVETTGPALAGVRIDVGPYRLITDADGRFEVALPPGEYEFRLDATSVPAAHRLVDATVLRVTIAAGERVPVVWRTIRTTVLDGLVREPPDANDASAPPRGVQTLLLVIDAEGLRRFVGTGTDGTFRLRGLAPGNVVVRLVEVPLGAVVIGATEQTLVLADGELAAVEFVVEPVRARAQSFTERAVRIRSVTVERERVPPGSAPIVRVEVVGEPDVVEIRFGDATVALAFGADGWSGRLQLSPSLGDGPQRFTVVALTDGAEVTRRAQVEIAADAPALEVVTNAPVRQGATLTVEVHAIVDLASLELRLDPDGTVAFRETSEGRWVASFVVPEDAAVGIREVHVVGVDVVGGVVAVVQSLRVLGE